MMTQNEKAASACLLAMLAGVVMACLGCTAVVSLKTRVPCLIEVGVEVDARPPQGDVLVPGVPLPAPDAQREVPETCPSGEDGEEVRGNAEAVTRCQGGVASRVRVNVEGERACMTRRKTPPDSHTSATYSNGQEARQLMEQRRGMVEVVGSFMPRPMWWATFTFRDPSTTTLDALSRFRFWLRQWRSRERCDGGSVKAPSYLVSRVVFCVEPQCRGTAHVHALLVSAADRTSPHCPACFSRTGSRLDWSVWKRLKESWYTHYGIARVYPYDDTLSAGAAAYVAKYMFKHPDAEWGIWESGKEY